MGSEMCIRDRAYESWVFWSRDTFAAEAKSLIADPDSAKALEELRNTMKQRLEGTGLFRLSAKKGGKFKLYPKGKDGPPLLLLSPEVGVRISEDVKRKGEMFKSSAVSTVYFGSWSQTGNRKSLTLRCGGNLCSENMVRAALSASDVTREVTIEKE